MKRKLYTTSEYLDALVTDASGNLYECKGKDFGLFSSAAAADYDAEWLLNYYRTHGIKKRKPTVYRIKLEKVRT